MKSEPSDYSIDDLIKDKKTHWDGVRTFQARNNMREMKVGDGVFFYHSNSDPKAIVGIATVCREAYPDFTQFDKDNKYYERRATEDKPYWFMVDIQFVTKFAKPWSLAMLREVPALEGMLLLKRGQRLSVQSVTSREWRAVCRLAEALEFA